MNDDAISSILIIAVLLLFSAYFSATETAFSSLNRTRLRTMAEKGNSKAALALSLAEKYDQLLSSILVACIQRSMVSFRWSTAAMTHFA